MPPSVEHRVAKVRRITKACDYCHRRSVRCMTIGAAGRCENCAAFDQPCTYTRETRRRGAKPKQKSATSVPTTPKLPATNADGDHSTTSAWHAPVIATQALIVDLVDIYFEVVYPIFPFFHRPTFVRKLISRGDYHTNKNLFATTMAMCALASARVRDQALFNPVWNTVELSAVPSETFYDSAVSAYQFGNDDCAKDLNMMRTSALLSLTAIQYGRIRDMQAHLGKYHTLVAMDSLHDELNWPDGIGVVEMEERRRLFWSIYTLEIYTSIIWNGVTRVREQQVNVRYPSELDDEHFSDRGKSQRAPSPVDLGTSPGGRWGEVGSSSWMSGWNFTTDLYRVMEHVITNFRDRKRHRRTFLGTMFGDQSTTSEASVREGIMQLYTNLPQCFKICPEVTCDPAIDRFGFQAANITATVQLLRMLLFASSGSSIEERCKIAIEVVDDFSRIPVAYLKATSSPLLHHLAGIGAILGSVFEEPMSDMAYEQVRAVLLALAQLLENLDHGVHSTVTTQRLRALVGQIDAVVQQSRLPAQVAIDFAEQWPWDLDLVQLAGSWG